MTDNTCTVLRAQIEEFTHTQARNAGVINSSEWRYQQTLGLLSIVLEDIQEIRGKSQPGPIHRPTRLERFLALSITELLT